MKATLLRPAALLLAALSTCPAYGQHVIWCAPALHRPLGTAPDACGPGFYWANEHGVFFGPSYYLQPPFGPESGITPVQALYGNCYNPGFGGQSPYGGPNYGYGGPNYGYGQHPYGNYPGQGVAHPGMMATPGAPGALPSPGALPNPGPLPPQAQPPTFVSHPFSRSPRDFFMWNEVQEDALKRYKLPVGVP